MRKVFVILGALTLGVFANCGKKDEGPKVSSDMSAACYYMQRQSGQNPNQAYGTGCYYNYGAVQGFSPYYGAQNPGYSYYSYGSSGAGGCGMMSGTGSMVYSPSKGAGCV